MPSADSAPPARVPEVSSEPSAKTSDDHPSLMCARFEKIVETHVWPVLRQIIEEQRAFVGAVDELINEKDQAISISRRTENKPAFFEAYTEYNRALFRLIEHRHKHNEAPAIVDIFSDFAQAIQQFIRETPTFYTEEQKEDRFVGLHHEKLKVRLLKFAKRQYRTISLVPWAAKSAFYYLTRKKTRAKPPRTYRIPLRNLIRFYYREEWYSQMATILEKIYHRSAMTTRQLWQLEDEAYAGVYTHLIENYGENEEWLTQTPELRQETYAARVDELRHSLDELEAQTEQEIKETLAGVNQQFAYAYDRVGTIELPARQFGNRVIRRQKEQTARRVQTGTQGWYNTLYALYEDWRIDQEINVLCTALFDEHTRLQKGLREKVVEAVGPQVDRMIACIDEVKDAIRHPPEGQLRQRLQKQQEVIDFQLIRSIIPSSVAVLYRQALPATVSMVYENIRAAVEQIAEKRALVSTNEYDGPLKKNSIDYISPQQLISFESLPKLLNAINEAKEEIGKDVLETQKMMTEIGQVSYFTLDSALSLYEDTEEGPEKVAVMADEGLQRAHKSMEAVKTKLQEVQETIDVSVWQAIKQFNADLLSLKSNDYALEIKLRIAKAKALERTQALKQQSLDYLKHGIPYAARYAQQQYQEMSGLLTRYRKRMGIVAVDGAVTTEVSDFLNDTEVAVDRLPYVYQRLYGNRPLEEVVFYEERSSEAAVLQKAYHNWGRGRYASAILVGEKGTGATTLINFFLKKLPPMERNRYEVLRVDTSGRVYTEAGLLQLLSDQLPGTQFDKADQAVDYLNNSPHPYIIVWEDIQHAFLRRVGGFAALTLLFELISRTHKRVFWLCACTQYAWDFLDKTTRISDYFEYIIPLEAVSSEQLREAILKRHRVSGYRVRYAGTVAERSRKKLAKLSHEQQQHYLEKLYFEDLAQLTAGNYSIAQLYWLRSTQQVLNDTITIGSLHMVDFSFTQSIPLPQMLILHALLLHDGLSEAHFLEINERKKQRDPVTTHLGLRQLRDDGLITLRDEIYVINPFLYRHVVQLLRSKNFLH